jgi:hypothetical protein
VKKRLADVERWFEKDRDVETDIPNEAGEETERQRRLFVTGDKPVFSDFVIGATFAYMRNVWGEDHERWKEVLTWDDGRWAQFVDALREFEQVK